MSDAAILQWLGENDTGSSSKTIALSALGSMPANAGGRYPTGCADFGRCHRLLTAAPHAKRGLDALAKDGGPYWAALCVRWAEITKTYEAEMAASATSGSATYALMSSILRPIEDGDKRFIRLNAGASIRFGP